MELSIIRGVLIVIFLSCVTNLKMKDFKSWVAIISLNILVSF